MSEPLYAFGMTEVMCECGQALEGEEESMDARFPDRRPDVSCHLHYLDVHTSRDDKILLAPNEDVEFFCSDCNRLLPFYSFYVHPREATP